MFTTVMKTLLLTLLHRVNTHMTYIWTVHFILVLLGSSPHLPHQDCVNEQQTSHRE